MGYFSEEIHFLLFTRSGLERNLFYFKPKLPGEIYLVKFAEVKTAFERNLKFLNQILESIKITERIRALGLSKVGKEISPEDVVFQRVPCRSKLGRFSYICYPST